MAKVATAATSTACNNNNNLQQQHCPTLSNTCSQGMCGVLLIAEILIFVRNIVVVAASAFVFLSS